MTLLTKRLSAPLSTWQDTGPVCFHLRFDSDVSLLEGEYSLLHLQRQIAAMSQYFQTHGITQDTSLLLFHDNSFYFLSALLAANLLGIKVVLPANCQPDYLKSLNLAVDFCLIESRYMVDVDVVAAKHFIDPQNVTLKAAPDVSQDAEKLAVFCQTFLNKPLDKSAELELFTSGSTGTPVVIRKKWALLLAEVEVLEDSFAAHLTSSTKVYSTVSHQHIYGLLFRVLWPLLSGRSFQDMNMLYPESILADMASTEAKAILVSSPAQLKRWVEHEQFSQLQHSLALLFSSGGPLPDDAAKSINIGLELAAIEVYGSTETGGVAWRQRNLDNNYSPLWRVFDGIKIGLSDIGCLSVSSPFIHKTLLSSDGLYITQDKVSLEGMRCFTLQGRVDRIIKLEEKRLSLDAMESCIVDIDYIDSVKVLVLSQSGKRDCLAAVAILTAVGKKVLAEQKKTGLVQQLKAQIGLSFERVLLPRKWRFVDAIPSNQQSKTTQWMLSELFESPESLVQTKPEQAKPTPTINMLAFPFSTARVQPFAEYEIIVNANDQLIAHIRLPETDVFFESHFQEIGVLPGVIQIDWAMQLTQAWFQPQQFIAMQRFKFKLPIMPGQCIRLALSKSNKIKEQLILGDKKEVSTVSFEFSQINNMSVDADIAHIFSSGNLLFSLHEVSAAKNSNVQLQQAENIVNEVLDV